MDRLRDKMVLEAEMGRRRPLERSGPTPLLRVHERDGQHGYVGPVVIRHVGEKLPDAGRAGLEIFTETELPGALA